MRVAFNQDSSCVVSSSPHGFRVFNSEPFGQFYASNELESPVRGVGLAEMLFSTSLVVVTGSAENSDEHTSPRQLAVINTKKQGQQALICELTFPTAVKAVRLNRQRLTVALEAELYIYDIANMRLLKQLEGVKSGIIDVSRSGNNWLAYSASAAAGSGVTVPNAPTPEPETATEPEPRLESETVHKTQSPEATLKRRSASGTLEPSKHGVGDVIVYDMGSLTPISVIHAHRSPLATLTLNEDGTLLATTSQKGTLVRVFAVPSGTLLHEFRRGSYQSQVYSLAFSLSSELLCVSSATQTVHIYKLGVDSPESVNKSKDRWFGASASRDFAWFKLPLKHNIRTTLGIAPLSNTVYVASETGKLFHYTVNQQDGGECKQTGQYSLA